MGVQIYQGTSLFADDLDLSGDTNTLGLDHGAETAGRTTLADDTRISKGGLLTSGFSMEGYWSEPVDDFWFNKISVDDVPVLIAPNGDAAGNRAFMLLAVGTTYNPGGAVGDAYSFSVSGSATGKLIRGLMYLPKTARTSSGNSSVQNPGSVGQDQSLYAVQHVFSVSGTSPTLDTVVKGDTDTDFGDGDETTHLTFSQATAAGSERISKAGSLSSTHYRVEFTIGGTSPSFTFAVAVGIQ